MTLSPSILAGNLAVDLVVAAARKEPSVGSAVEALRKLAAGQDGVLGTADDRLDPRVLETLTFLLESGVAKRVVELVASKTGCITGALGRLCGRQ